MHYTAFPTTIEVAHKYKVGDHIKYDLDDDPYEVLEVTVKNGEARYTLKSLGTNIVYRNETGGSTSFLVPASKPKPYVTYTIVVEQFDDRVLSASTVPYVTEAAIREALPRKNFKITSSYHRSVA